MPRRFLALLALLALACSACAPTSDPPTPAAPATSTAVAPVAPVVLASADGLVPPLAVNVDDAHADGGPHHERAHAHPHGEQMCASGCALSRHPTPVLDEAEFLRLRASFAAEPLAPVGKAQDALMYYGPQAQQWLAERGPGPLDAARRALLERELPRRSATVELRVVDRTGRRRVYLPPTRVPLDLRQVFALDVDGLPRPLEMSGTVKRVGTHHLWQRL